MKHSFTALIMATCIAFSAFAQETLTVKGDAPIQYTVKDGDTLWDISKLYLSSPWQWQMLWQQNPQLSNPHLIYPGDVLKLQFDSQGLPLLLLDKGVKKLSPVARVTVQKSTAIPTLPMALIEPLIAFEQALSEQDLKGHPYVLGANYNVKLATQGHVLYVKGDLEQYTHYGIYNIGDPYLDPKSTEILAYEVRLVGTARVLAEGNLAQGAPAKVRVESAKREIKASDILMPLSKGHSFSVQFNMLRPSQEVNGTIIASDNKLREFGATSVVILNIGKEQQLKEGHILDINKRSPTVIEGNKGPRYVEDANSLEKFTKSVRELFGTENTDNSVVWTMPEEKVGELMVFKVYDKVSYALVTDATQPIRVGDSVSVN
ncbi:LysM peptidoglycan-binding domain-containing protein [Pseudoalteromonas sp. JBTF-M23]|uniref:LysM peptidoglycan-binding domain-containing protein n=1 Tax=Pseudoalteromonas caenipelagi TaxID=2726988 RepID=A0A849VCJ0_9GAMM|nr:LysM domain-containing protein [Pseudoalteromonas caenipelagi]NOU51389.1 LysM peptidoglycan-binding domain-containing protein [Pseudoalteromonas caenipelagi]